MHIDELPRDRIDSHCHVASEDFLPRSFLEGVVENVAVVMAAQGLAARKSTLLDLYRSRLQDPDCDELRAEMQAAGIAQAVLLLPDLTFALRDATLTIEEMIERHRAILERHPDTFYVLAGVDPRWGADGVDLFERAVRDYSFHGLKVYPPCGYPADDTGLYPYYEICAARGLPALVHMGGTSPALAFDSARPGPVDRAALDFPGVDFILAHGATAHPEECALLCQFRPNVYLDVSAYQARELDVVAAVFRRGIGHKLLFGTDWPLFRIQGTQREHLEALVAGAGLERLRAFELSGFFGGTARRLLGSSERR